MAKRKKAAKKVESESANIEDQEKKDTRPANSDYENHPKFAKFKKVKGA